MRILLTALLLTVSACTPEQKVNIIDISGNEPKVIPPACPDWTSQSSQTYINDVHSNFSCATVNNIGQMVVDPIDMVEGKSANTYPGTKTANAVRGYNTSGSSGPSSVPAAAPSATAAQ